MKISDRMALANGKNSGFDYLRLVLALSVIGFHSVVLCYGDKTQQAVNDSAWGILVGLIVPMFFALSGFLVAGSLIRVPNLAVFVGLRIFRIVPALLVDTLFCALFIGPFLATMSLGDYFTDPEFHAYFLNIVGDIHYYLPGLFTDNPMGKVNGQLWTIPFELECYVVLAALGFLGLHRFRALFLIAVVSMMAVLEVHLLIDGGTAWRNLILCFLAGVVLYLFRDKIPMRWPYFGIAAVLSCVILAIPAAGYLLGFPVAYATVFLGLLNPKKSALLQSGDYSYGLYLYGFPLQQALVTMTPYARDWYGNLLLGVPLSFAFAFFSWHVVEKNILRQKKILYSVFRWKPAEVSAAAASTIRRRFPFLR